MTQRLHLFPQSHQNSPRPELFTFPFFYQTHPLAEFAADQLKLRIEQHTEWQKALEKSGKMFGVLVVEDHNKQLGYLWAFSGTLASKNLWPEFVPPILNNQDEAGFFQAQYRKINEFIEQIRELEGSNEWQLTAESLTQMEQTAAQEIEQWRLQTIENRANRKSKRQQIQNEPESETKKKTLDELAKASVYDKNYAKHLKQQWENKLLPLREKVAVFRSELAALKDKRKQISSSLSKRWFDDFRVSNALGDSLSLNTIFDEHSKIVPPAGSGDCAAPKLLNYAYQNELKPLAMAEFWMGLSPKNEVRHHGQYYPSCHSKCQPILGHMLKGLNVEPDPLQHSWAHDKPMKIVYQDESIVVVNKPAGLLSVPGKTIKDSAYSRLKAQFSDADDVFVLHRLDMATSGLLVFGFTSRANKHLQKQFIAREVKKTYVALLDGVLEQEKGDVRLPLRGDPDDRPRQLVCLEHGKPAHSSYQVLERTDTHTRVELSPHTGRTHQLRVHCAHEQGLATPILGDGLYGIRGDRLHLHAQTLEFTHPITKQRMRFSCQPDF